MTTIKIKVIETNDPYPARDKINQAGDIACTVGQRPVMIPDDIVIEAAIRKGGLPDYYEVADKTTRPREWRFGHRRPGEPAWLTQTLWTPSGRRSSECWQGAVPVRVEGYTQLDECCASRMYSAWYRDDIAAMILVSA